MKKSRNLLYSFLGAGLLIFGGCQVTEESHGTLKVSITDAPFPIEIIEEANVTITKVEVRMKSDTSDATFTTLMEESRDINLLDLRNGVVSELLEMEMPAGTYDLIRVYVENASLKIIDGETYEVKVPSGSQTGIKIFIQPELRIEGGLTSEVLLDFNLEKSFVVRGNPMTPAGIKGFNFKPVIRAVNNSTAGSVEGMVSDTASAVLANAAVWIAQDSTIASAFTDSTGYYAIPGIPEGFYSLYSSKENYDTVMYENVEIVAGNRIDMDFVLTPTE